MNPATPRSSRIWLPILLLSLAATWPAMATDYSGMNDALVTLVVYAGVGLVGFLVILTIVSLFMAGKFRARAGAIVGVILGLCVAVPLTVAAYRFAIWAESVLYALPMLLVGWGVVLLPIGQYRLARRAAAKQPDDDPPVPDADARTDDA